MHMQVQLLEVAPTITPTEQISLQNSGSKAAAKRQQLLWQMQRKPSTMLSSRAIAGALLGCRQKRYRASQRVGMISTHSSRKEEAWTFLLPLIR
jgi:hypothetical protein